MFCSRTFGIWLMKKHIMPAEEIVAVMLKAFFFLVYIYYFVSMSTLSSRREHFTVSRRDCKHATSTVKWCHLTFYFAFSIIDHSSPPRMDSLMQLTVSFLAFMCFSRWNIWWIVVGVQRVEFCPLCSNIYPFLPYSL